MEDKSNENYERAKQMGLFDGMSSFDYDTYHNVLSYPLGKQITFVETSSCVLGFDERKSATDGTFFCDTPSMSHQIGCRFDNEDGITAQLINHPSVMQDDPPPRQIDAFEAGSADRAYRAINDTSVYEASSSCGEAVSGLVGGVPERTSDYQMGSHVQMPPPQMDSWKSDMISMCQMRRVQDSALVRKMGTRTTMPTTLAGVHKTIWSPQVGRQGIMKGHKNETIGIRERMTASRTNPTCCCSCRLSQCSDTHFPAFGLKNQRQSVIMIPVKCIQFGETSKDDSSSSEEDDGKEQTQSYFRKNINGTTAKFNLSKEDWKRIPINSFPSGGRLLSGDWTRIFVSKVKESNPWCSLRFKNNHVRSENSRKIHSAVFFRGGAECKRPECSVKVRFVIRKEKGKYVEVTYVGNVCHSRSGDRK